MTAPAPPLAHPNAQTLAAELNAVDVSFDGASVLSQVSLQVPSGTRLGIIGPAASGKSVMAKLWCGLMAPTRGTVRTLGTDMGQASPAAASAVRARVGMLFQNYALFDFLSVLDNVTFALERRGGLAASEIEAKAAARLRAVGLAGSEHKFPAQLSGGMKKRVGIARASVAAPELMIYDEPTAGLDPVTTQKVYDLLAADHAQSGGTVIVISSDVLALSRFATQLAFLYQGAIRYVGPAANIEHCDNLAVRQFARGDADGPLTSGALHGHTEGFA